MYKVLGSLIILSFIVVSTAHSGLGLEVGAGIGFDHYDDLELISEPHTPTHFTGNFYVAHNTFKNLNLGVDCSITKLELRHLSIEGIHSVPIYKAGPMFIYRIWSKNENRFGVSLRPALQYVWGYLLYYPDYRGDFQRHGTYRGYNVRLAVDTHYSILNVSLGYDFSEIKIYNAGHSQRVIDVGGWDKLNLSGFRVSVGISLHV